MINVLKIGLKVSSTIQKSLSVIESGSVKIALILNDECQLLGTLSDGDIRRALLRKKTLQDTIEDVYFKNPIVATKNSTNEELLHLCLVNKIAQLPIVDENNVLIDLFTLNENQPTKQYDNTVVLMVGGLGSRLRPMTKDTPKPMLEIGGQPILQTIVEGFLKHGFVNIVMCLGYKADMIQNFFQDGSKFGVKIEYITEEKRMGTAGALTLLKNKIDKPFFVMNGDILTNVNYEQMFEFHELNNAIATMCIREYDIEVPYGVVNINNENICSIEEKPIHSFFVNAGIYLLDPKSIDLIPINEFYDMTSLFETLISNNERTISFPLKEYWMDVGNHSDFFKAQVEVDLWK